MAEDNPLRGKGHNSKAAYGPVQPGPAGTAPRRGCWSSLQEKFPILTKRPFQVLLLLLCILPFGLLGLLALRNRNHDDATCTSGNCSSGNKNAIKDDAYFYGQSQPYYPSPNLTAAAVPTWADSVDKAIAMVRNMTLEEKVSLTTGAPSGTGCSGSIPPISRLGFPGLCLSDAGNGLRATDFVTRQRAINMGMEFRTKGVNVALGPVVGPIGRVVQGGRNWEGFAAEPWLSGAFAFETVKGIQSVGVITSTKHFIGNEQETVRVPANAKEAVSSNIDDKTMHEVYLWPFQDAVRAGSGNIMCSYNRVNNSYGCQNSYTQNYLLKEELGFQGFVVSDWSAQHSGVASALAGMDMVMPNSDLWGNTLVQAVRNGSVPQVRLDDMAVRIVASWYQMKQDQGFPEPGFGMPPDLTKPHRIVDARNISSKRVLFDGAVEGHVLVKNSKGALPFRNPRMLSLYGYSARNPDQWNYNATGGVSAWSFGGESAYQGRDVAGAFALDSQDQLPQIAPNGTIISGGGSGAVTPAYISSPFDALNARAYEDGTALFWDFTSAEPYVDSASDACIVMLNAFSSEGYDRPGIRDKYSDDLIQHVAQSCNNTIVVFHNAGTRLVEEFIDHPNVTAVIFAHLPGQDSGHALVSILYGESNPSGKLPYTVAANESDYSNLLKPDLPEGMFEIFPQSNFTEGVYIDYRHFDAKNITPRFEFGSTGTPAARQRVTHQDRSRKGGPSDLWHTMATISADIQNTGEVDGAEAAQLYVGIPGAPIRQLRGFEKPFINTTQSATVSFKLSRRDLSVWDVVSQKWLLQKGRYGVWVGASSRKLPLQGGFDL
ncbi:glycoside hydrolase superfamily [Apiospora rasikravindrae]|uniref:beta-glucosidase n=1 Tax=Apiospora rasikravindrae TaxID=990691 RepID=A0ABR1T6K0_9PEZI